MVKTNLFGVFWGSASLFLCLSCPRQTQAQIVPDSTLPVNSAVTVDGSTTTITGGTRAGSNLFHSFEQFSVTTNGTAFFNNPLDIENILTRVTGGSISNIDGLIQGNGEANLFLLNPNGIVFGPNARLDIGGSFLASTASSVVFADGNFSATDPNNTPLLSVNVPLGVQFGATANAIANQSTVTDSNSNIVGLQVNGGETLALLGGDLNLEGGHLNAPSGRIELGSVAPNSQVNLTVDDAGLTLGYESVQNFQDIQLSQQAVVSTSSTAGGDIQIQARELSVRDGSKVSASTQGDRPAGNLTVTATEFVEVSGAATNNENQLTFSTLAATSSSLATGNSGNINIQTKKLMASGGGDISVSVFGTGNSGQSGNLTVNASESIELIGAVVNPNDGENFSRSGLFAATEGTGNAGYLTVNTPQLTVRDGARISVSTRGPGRDGIPGGTGGSLTVNAEDIQLSGISDNGQFPSGLFALSGEKRPNIAENAATGNGGNIDIKSDRLNLQGEAAISVAAFGSGAAGTLSIEATESIEMTGIGKLQILEAILNANPDNPITSSDLVGGIFTSGFDGGSGALTIETGKLLLQNGAVVSASTFGSGSGGEFTIDTQGGSVELIGSGLLAGTSGSGASGNITIETGQLTLKEGSLVSTVSTLPEAGDGGDLRVRADVIELTGVSTEPLDLPIFVEVTQTPEGQPQFNNLGPQPIPSSLLAVTFGAGNSGNVEVTVRELKIDRGAAIATTTFGAGDGGNITIRSAESVELVGTTRGQILNELLSSAIDASDINDGLFSLALPNPRNPQNPTQTGSAGNISIETQKLTVENGAGILATTLTEGQGGKLTIDASDSLEVTGASVLFTGTSGAGAAGDLTIGTGNLTVRDAAVISTTTFSQDETGQGGDLTVTTPATGIVELIGAPDADSVRFSQSQRSIRVIPTGLQTSSVGNGPAGNLTIETGQLIVREGAAAASAALGGGSGGQLTVNAESVQLIGTSTDTASQSALSAFTETDAPAGSLVINTGTLTVQDGGLVSAITFFGNGKGGNVTIDATESVQAIGLSQQNPSLDGIVASSGSPGVPDNAPTATGEGGNITITTPQLIVRDGSVVSTASFSDGQAGTLTIKAAESVEVIGGSTDGQNFSTLAATSNTTGNSGTIDINTSRFTAANGADVSVSVLGTDNPGRSGTLKIVATDSVELIGAGTSPDGSNFSRSGLFAATEGTGSGGNLTVNTPQLIVKDGARISVSTRGSGENGVPGGEGGNLTVAASESIELSGQFISTDGRVFPSGLFALSGEQRPTIPATAATGDGGNLDVTTDRLTVRDEAEVSINAQGSGAAGNLNIDARLIRLNNGSISGETASGTGGNVTLRISDVLLACCNSEISTTLGETGDGANVTIDANIIATENSIITAKTSAGVGGNLEIAAQEIFQVDSNTASSQLGIVDFPQEVTDTAEQVARVCQKDREDSSFTIAGRGGLPPRPSEPLSSEALVGFDSLSQSAENVETRNVETRNVETRNFASLPESDEIALAPPARGWFVNDRGELVLSWQPLNVMSQSSSFSAAKCDVR